LKITIKKKQRREIVNALALLTQLGLSAAACVLIGVMAGRFLDGRLGTSPWLLIAFTVMGAAAAIKVMYDTAMKNIGNKDKDDGEK